MGKCVSAFVVLVAVLLMSSMAMLNAEVPAPDMHRHAPAPAPYGRGPAPAPRYMRGGPAPAPTVDYGVPEYAPAYSPEPAESSPPSYAPGFGPSVVYYYPNSAPGPMSA